MDTIVPQASDNTTAPTRREARLAQARARRNYDHDDRNDAVIGRVSERIDFRLTYARLPEPRCMVEDGIDGPSIDDAYGDGSAPGEWSNGEDLRWMTGLTDDNAAEFWFSSAVNEAVHEALEWFRIDGAPALDPHGKQEGSIYEAVNALAAQLWSLRGSGGVL